MPICGKRDRLPTLETIWSFFEASCLRAPNSLAIVDAESFQKLTYNQFSTQVNKLSRYLLRLLSEVNDDGVADDTRPIAICIPPSIDLVLCLFAVIQIKRAYLPLDVDFPASRVKHILQDDKPQFLITSGKQPALSDLSSDNVDNVLLIDLQLSRNEIQSEKGTLVNQDLIPPSNGVVAVLYTSGSTGVPKGVRIPHSAILNRLIWQWKTFPYGQNEVCCFKTALTFVDSISEIFGPLLTSHQLVVVPKHITKQAEVLIRVLEDFRIGRLVLVPSLLRSLLLTASRLTQPLPRLKLWVCSGETLQPDLLYSFFDIFNDNQTICNFYGSTEVMGDVSFIQFKSSEDIINSLDNNKIPIGYPISNTDIYLLNNIMEEVPDGEVGELLVSGFNLADGYVGQPQSVRFIENSWNLVAGYTKLYRTGDFARYVNGNLIFEGRVDSQLKVRGHRVDLSEIEMTLQRIKEIDKCCVICYHPGETDQEIVAFFSSKEEETTVQQVKIKLVPLLAPYMQPMFLKVEEMPYLVNGKIDRQSLLKIFEDRGNKDALYDKEIDLSNCEAGKEEAGKMLVKTLIQVLGPSAPPSIGLTQSFWEIGGNSLNAILAITSYQDAGYYVGITEFLNSETLNDIIKHASKVEQNLFSRNDVKLEIEEDNYSCSLIKDEHKETVKEIVTTSFVSKGDLETLLDITQNEFNNVFEQMFDILMSRKLSFVVTRKETGEIIAVAINSDYNHESPICYPSKNIQYIYDFLEDCETKVRFCLPEGGKVFHSLLMATDEAISARENVALIQLMEIENMRLAKENKYNAIFTTNTSDLTQHVCDDLMSYKVLGTYQINTWKAEDGTRPFKDAVDNQFAVCSVILLDDEQENSVS